MKTLYREELIGEIKNYFDETNVVYPLGRTLLTVMGLHSWTKYVEMVGTFTTHERIRQAKENEHAQVHRVKPKGCLHGLVMVDQVLTVYLDAPPMREYAYMVGGLSAGDKTWTMQKLSGLIRYAKELQIAEREFQPGNVLYIVKEWFDSGLSSQILLDRPSYDYFRQARHLDHYYDYIDDAKQWRAAKERYETVEVMGMSSPERRQIWAKVLELVHGKTTETA